MEFKFIRKIFHWPMSKNINFVVYVLIHVSMFFLFIHWNDLSKTNHQNCTLTLIPHWNQATDWRQCYVSLCFLLIKQQQRKNKQMNFDYILNADRRWEKSDREKTMPSQIAHGSIRFVFVWTVIMLEKLKYFWNNGHFSLSIALLAKICW